MILNMVITFVLTPWSHYNTIIEPRAHFLFSLLEGLTIDFPLHMIVSMLDIYQDTTTCDKLIFFSAITCILTHMHVPIASTPLFPFMGAISQESLRRSDAQLAAKTKRLREESTFAQQQEADIRVVEDATYASRPPSSSSAPSSSFGVEASLAAIINQLQHMRADFSSHLDHLSNETCQMNTKIGHIDRRQSRFGGFAPSPSLNPSEESSDGGDDKSDDASGSASDDEMTISQ